MRSQARLPMMHASFLFTGAGTLLLGPILPLFAKQWSLQDAQSGGLIAALFFGLFTGAIALSANLRANLLCGASLAATGFLALASLFKHHQGFHTGLAALFVAGVGLGQITTTVNLLSALRYREPKRRASALSMLNFTWSAGAVLSPLLAAAFLSHGSVPGLLTCFGAASTALLVCTVLVLRAPPGLTPAVAAPPRTRGMRFSPLAYFIVLFFLYGGLEASLNGWLSTYTIRYTQLDASQAASITTFLWAAFAVGRAISALLLLHADEKVLRAGGIILSVAGAVLLRQAHTGYWVAVCAVLAGFGIAPFFAVTLSCLVARHPLPRQAGTATSMIGLGSAILPYVVGLISSQAGSLRGAMYVPIFLSASLLTLCVWPSGTEPHASPA